MASSKELRAWSDNVRQWAGVVENPDVRGKLLDLADQMERLAAQKEVAERQFV